MNDETRTYTFRPNWEVVARLPSVRPIAELAEEVGMYSATSEHTLWGQVHARLAEEMGRRAVRTRATSDGEVVLFDPWTLHRATPTRVRGWRLFFRLSQWHRPNLGGEGKLSRQEQVYKVVEGSGW